MSRLPGWAWFVTVVVAGALYLGPYLFRGWYPHDEGALGQTAERVIQGEVPHRDFDEPYTGLLTYVHAAAFRLGGVRLPVLRIPLFLMTMCWLAAMFAIARRMVSPAAAAGVALLALGWSVPNYPASIPSWYNLFFATFGVFGLLRWQESGARGWLWLAGVAGGLSFLVKLSGMFYVAGALVFLVFATKPESTADTSSTVSGGARSALAVTGGLLLLVALLWRSIAPYHIPRVIFHFVVPGGVLAAGLALREWKAPLSDTGLGRLRALMIATAFFLAGVALPVVGFVLGFAAAGALPALWDGVFVAPFRRLAFANLAPPAPYWILAAAPLGLLLRRRSDSTDSKWRRLGVLVALVLAGVLWLAGRDAFTYRVVWHSIRSLIPLVAILASVLVAAPRLASGWKPQRRTPFVLLASVTAFASLIQFPFAAPLYFLYVAPLLLLTLVALLQGMGGTPPPLACAVGGFYGVFVAILVTPGGVGLASKREAPMRTSRLEVPRGGLRVEVNEAVVYTALIRKLQARAAGRAIWAGPDAPEVYFLGGFRNRTRRTFDFLGSGDTTASRVIGEISDEAVHAVVLNLRPPFSPAPAPALLAAVRTRFPEGERVGPFELRWRK